jgi:uncharacterized lipoprotein YddW (UPF0748 family)
MRDQRHQNRSLGRYLCALLIAALPLSIHADGPGSAVTVSAAALDSADSARAAVSRALADSSRTVVVTVSPYLPTDLPFDGVAALIRVAHERGVRVHAALLTNVAVGVDEFPASRDHVLYLHPDWLMVPRAIAAEMQRTDLRSPGYVGRLARWSRANAPRVSGLYVSPLLPAATEYAARATEDLLRRYEFDEVDIHAVPCADDFDYSRAAMDVFRAAVRARLDAIERIRMDGIETLDPFAYPNEFPEEWHLFQRTRLDELVARVTVAVKNARPSIPLRAAVGDFAATGDTH